jgi:hypothetical protein
VLDNSLVNATAGKQLATPWYSDQVLPFDITLSGANEYGAMCAAKIFGVEILNEGWGISIDDAVSEMQATFVARVVEPMAAVASPFHIYMTRSPRPAGNKDPRARARKLRPASASVHSLQRLADGYQQTVFENRITDRRLQKTLRYSARNFDQLQLLLPFKQDEGTLVDRELDCR